MVMAFNTPYASLVPAMSPDDRRALEADLRHRGQEAPVLVDEENNIIDGHNRAAILGDAATTQIVSGLTEGEKKAFVITRATARRNMTAEQKGALRENMKAVASELRAEGRTQEKISEMLGVSQRTVSNWLDGGISNDSNAAVRGFQPKHPPEMREDAIARVRAGERKTDVARALGVPRSTVNEWLAKSSEEKPRPSPRDEALSRVSSGESQVVVAESLGVSPSTVSKWATDSGIQAKRGSPRPRPETVERQMGVLELHNQGLGTVEIARRLSIDPNQVSYAKTRLGIAENSPGVKLWGDIDHLATLLEGTSLKVEEVVARLSSSEPTADPTEIRRCISSLSQSQRTVRELINALKRRRQ
jgi:predicted transcriptional regulator